MPERPVDVQVVTARVDRAVADQVWLLDRWCPNGSGLQWPV